MDSCHLDRSVAEWRDLRFLSGPVARRVIAFSQQFVRCFDYLLRRDGQQAGLRLRVPGVVALAFGVPQHAEGHTKGTVPAGIGGPIDAYYRLAQRAGQMQRSRVPGDDQADAAGESDQPLQGKLRRLGNTAAGAHYLGSDRPLLRTGIHQHHAALLRADPLATAP